MTNEIQEFETLLTLASAWVEEQEQIVLRDGVPLNEFQIADAIAGGVSHPERVRLLTAEQVPMPQHPRLRAVCESTKAITPGTWAMSLRYGIVVRTDRKDQRYVVVHELVHTSQYEKLGGIRPFLRQYLQECLTVGYPQNPMEQEAIVTAKKICAGE